MRPTSTREKRLCSLQDPVSKANDIMQRMVGGISTPRIEVVKYNGRSNCRNYHGRLLLFASWNVCDEIRGKDARILARKCPATQGTILHTSVAAGG